MKRYKTFQPISMGDQQPNDFEEICSTGNYPISAIGHNLGSTTSRKPSQLTFLPKQNSLLYRNLVIHTGADDYYYANNPSGEDNDIEKSPESNTQLPLLTISPDFCSGGSQDDTEHHMHGSPCDITGSPAPSSSSLSVFSYNQLNTNDSGIDSTQPSPRDGSSPELSGRRRSKDLLHPDDARMSALHSSRETGETDTSIDLEEPSDIYETADGYDEEDEVSSTTGQEESTVEDEPCSYIQEDVNMGSVPKPSSYSSVEEEPTCSAQMKNSTEDVGNVSSAEDSFSGVSCSSEGVSTSQVGLHIQRDEELSRNSSVLSTTAALEQMEIQYKDWLLLDPHSIYHTPRRLTFTQTLAFPTLLLTPSIDEEDVEVDGAVAARRLSGKRRQLEKRRSDPHVETERNLNRFAVLITIIVLALVGVLVLGVLYRFLSGDMNGKKRHG